MFEFIKMIHEALGIESTWAFVLVVASVFALLGGGVGFLVDKQYKNSSAYKAGHALQNPDNESVGQIRSLLADGNRIVQMCQSVPDPYHTPASSRAELANVIVQFENRADTILSMDPDPQPQRMWRKAVLYAAPEKTPSIALYCTQLNVKMDVLNRVLKRKLTTHQQLQGQLERFIREGVSLRATCTKGQNDATNVAHDQLNWISKVMDWLGDNFDESYQDQFNSVAPEPNNTFQDYPPSVKGPCERMQPRIEVLESICKELGTT